MNKCCNNCKYIKPVKSRYGGYKCIRIHTKFYKTTIAGLDQTKDYCSLWESKDSMPKDLVFCKDCTGYDKNLFSIRPDGGYLCRHTKHKAACSIESYDAYESCHILNKNNNCKLYKAKPKKKSLWIF